MKSAIKIWSRAEGRAKSDIEWRFKVREGMEYPATALPNISLKNGDQLSTPLDPSRLTVKEIFGALTPGQLRSLFAAFAAILVAAYLLGAKFG